MILPRRPMTPRIHGTSEATERGSVKRMISWTAPIGSAYSSEPSENTTSCREVVSDMSFTQIGESAKRLSACEFFDRRRSDDRGGAEGMYRLRLPAGGKAYDEACAATVQRWRERDAALMALGDRLHDRQAEPRGARTVAVGAEEPLEHLVAQLVRDAGAVVLDREHHVAVVALHAGLDRGARVRVAQRVLHQVQDEPVKFVLHALDLQAGRGGDRDVVIAGHGL